MKVEGCMMKDEGLKMKDEGFGGFDNRQTDRLTDICDCRVAFATEKMVKLLTKGNKLYKAVRFVLILWSPCTCSCIVIIR